MKLQGEGGRVNILQLGIQPEYCGSHSFVEKEMYHSIVMLPSSHLKDLPPQSSSDSFHLITMFSVYFKEPTARYKNANFFFLNMFCIKEISLFIKLDLYRIYKEQNR